MAGDEQLLAESPNLVVAERAVDLGTGHHREHVVGQCLAGTVQHSSLLDQFVDEGEDVSVRILRQARVTTAERVDDVVGPSPELITAFGRHSEQDRDDDRREREGEEPNEVTLAVAPTERLVPQSIADSVDLGFHARDGSGPEGVLQNASLTPMVRVVGRAEHPTLLGVHTDAEPVAPLARSRHEVEHVTMATGHVERRVVGDLGVQWTARAEHRMANRRLEVVGVREV